MLLYFNFIKFPFFYLSIFRLVVIYDSINYFWATATNAVKKFCLRRAFVAPVFNYIMFALIFPVFQFQEVSIYGYILYSVHDSINYLCATVTNAAKSFACGELSSLVFFNLILFPLIFFCISISLGFDYLRFH